MKKKTTSIMVLVLIVSLLSACQVFGPNQPVATQDPNAVGTAAAQTAAIQITLSSLQTQVARLTAVPSQAVGTPVPTIAPQNTATRTPFVTLTPLPSFTPFKTATPLPSFTPQAPCNAAGFVKDVTIPDNTKITAKNAFLKTWRVQNVGSCTWTTDYSLTFSSGDKMSGPDSQKLTAAVKPGEIVDVSVELIAPAVTGKYTGKWMFKSSGGIVFGVGASHSNPITVVIESTSPGSFVPTDWTKNFCVADWKSNSGNLNCPAVKEDFTKGSIYMLETPKLETLAVENEPALIMIPANGTGGMISGTFPSYTVKGGDTFKVVIGCLADSPKCNVMFQLTYSADGGPATSLGSWTQTSDKSIQTISVGLAGLVGKSVKFTLVVQNNNASSEDDRAFWLAPRIVTTP